MFSLWRIVLAAAALGPSTVAAAQDFSITSNGLSTWDQSDWSLTATEYIPGHFQTRLHLANGYVGAGLAAAGPFFELEVNETDPSGPAPTNGWPLFDPRIAFSTISGFWNVQKNATGTNYPWLSQYGWDSFIAGIPHPTAIVFAFGDTWLDAKASNTTISNFKQKLSMKTGVAEWSYTWKPAGSAVSFDVTFATIFSRVRPNVVATKATIKASTDANVTATDLLDGRSAVRSYLDQKGVDTEGGQSSIYVAVHPNGLANVTGWEVSISDFPSVSSPRNASGPYVGNNESTIGLTYGLSLRAGQDVTLYKYVGIASTDKFPDAESVAKQAAASAKSAGWAALVAEHSAAWGELMTDSAVDNYTDPSTGKLPANSDVQTLQIATVSSTFYLLQNLLPDDGSGLNDNSISVGGLASDSYSGQVFWDADTWMAPGLNLAFPNYAKQIPNFRVKQHPQSLANAAFNNWPNGSSLYSWTTGRYGNCTATGPCVDYEYHLNYDISFNMLQLYNITGNASWFGAGPEQVVFSTAEMTAFLLKLNETDGTYWLYNATDPDEYANNVNNTAFTIASASKLLTVANELLMAQGQPENETWSVMARDIAIPIAETNITMEYETMNNSVVVKQADVVLLSYPLGFTLNYTTHEAILDLDYYSIKQSPDGPAMTFDIYVANSNALAASGCAAYTYALKAFLPYLRAPWYQFSEQQVDDPNINGGTNPAFPFLTGHGGALQVGPYGFLGLRTDRPSLYISPSLPPQIPSLRVRTFYYAGASFSALINSTHTALTRVTPQETVNTTYAGAGSMEFVVGAPDGAGTLTETSYTIAEGETVVVPNRLYWQNVTFADNVLQCAPVAQSDPYVAGQVPQGANDGASATSWQPATNESASLWIDTSAVPSRRVKGLFFDFGARPIASAKVGFWNSTGDCVEVGFVLAVDGIMPDVPTQSADMIVPVVDNTTAVALGDNLDVWIGDYVSLTVMGCVGCDESKGPVGGTIAEFVVY